MAPLLFWRQCNIVEHRNYKVVYRRYASLFFLMGIDAEEVRGQALRGARCGLRVALLFGRLR